MSPPTQPDLFGPRAGWPEGLVYEPAFLTPEEEAHWIAVVQALPLREADYKGHMARRRVASYLTRYDFDGNRLHAGEPLPQALAALVERVAQWMGVAPGAIANVLVAEYRPGTPLGWHRDVPPFEHIAGVSLAADALLRLRRYPPVARAPTLDLTLEARSIYALAGEARWGWQHAVPPVPALRYSITCRTRVRRG